MCKALNKNQVLTPIPHNKPTLGKEEEEAAIRVIRSGWVAEGREVDGFEDEFCEFLGLPRGHAVALSSGTVSLFMAFWVLGGKGKKTAYPVYACSALRNAAALAGVEEIIIDNAPDSPNMDLSVLQKSGTHIAVIPHIFGIPADISGLDGIDVIEDCAQSLGAIAKGIKTGLSGRVGIYSFYATKLITSGGNGGMFVSKDEALSDAVRDYREFDQRRDDKRRFNFQMTDLQAAIGREQLKKLPWFLERREEIFGMYKDAGLKLLDSTNKNFIPVRYRAVLLTPSPRKIIDSLSKVGVKAIVPVEDWELLGEPEKFPSALRLTKETVSLPVYPLLDNVDVQKIISVVEKQ